MCERAWKFSHLYVPNCYFFQCLSSLGTYEFCLHVCQLLCYMYILCSFPIMTWHYKRLTNCRQTPTSRQSMHMCEPGGGGGGTSILKVMGTWGTCRWTGYDFAVINISTGYLVALLRSSILAQGILWPSCGHQY